MSLVKFNKFIGINLTGGLDWTDVSSDFWSGCSYQMESLD